ncbi:winged helix-turn-helix domain-containing protein [Telmatobacter sp. DSM 110680]|uniref:Winged helix-turn-helix domain-containing protein n=1 Tax=Telmatobacter sp. DSM 110680 TaxID=3036704 RepID=A0AAU7DK09_9BACT
MPSQPVGLQESILFGEDFELDLRPRRLRRGGRVLKLERIPLDILLLLLEHPGEIVTREEIVARVWGTDVFLDTDNSIRGAIRKIRQVLKDDPEQPRFIQTVTGRGYRFIAPVVSPGEEGSAELIGLEGPVARTDAQRAILEPADGRQDNGLHVGDEPEPAAAEFPIAEGAPVLGHRRSRTWLLVGMAALALLGLVALPAWWRWRARVAVASQPKTVLAVLPFDNLSGDADQEFFSDGLTEEMISQIGKLNRDRLIVIARSSIAKYKDSKQTAKEIGRELNADYLVQGSVRGSPDRVRITVELIDAKKQTDVWTESYDRELKDVLAVQDSVVRSIANEIHIVLAEDQKRRLASSRQTVPEAYVEYLKGRYYWNKRTGDSIAKAEQYFQQAIDRDPTFSAAYSGLADCNSGLAWHGFKAPADSLPKAYAAARKAIEIDPESAEAHASLGLVLSHRWEWAGAEAEFRRALELDPQYANAHHWYGDYLSIRGRHDQALAEARHALALDPLNLTISTWVGLRYYMARNYFAAIQQNRDSVEMDPNFAAAHLVLGEDYVQVGMHNEAVNELKRAASLSGDSPLYTAQVAIALAAAGRNREALQIAHELEANAKKRYVSPYALAQIFAALKMDRETFTWLEAAWGDHAVWMGYLAVDPIFDRYRSDARFQELLGRVGLP